MQVIVRGDDKKNKETMICFATRNTLYSTPEMNVGITERQSVIKRDTYITTIEVPANLF
jgi:hypothetical protein